MKIKPSIKGVVLESAIVAAVITFVIFLIPGWEKIFSYLGVAFSFIVVFFILFFLHSFVNYHDKLNFIEANLQEETPPPSVSKDKPVQLRPRRPC